MSKPFLRPHKEQLISPLAQLAATENVELTVKPMHFKMLTSMIYIARNKSTSPFKDEDNIM